MLRPFERERFGRLVELSRNRFDTALTLAEERSSTALGDSL
jgi:hypothetical protein